MSTSTREAKRAYLETWELAMDAKRGPDIAGFLANFKIESKKGPIVFFDLNIVQEMITAEIRRLEDEGLPVRLIILKARQFGVSSFVIARMFERCVREEGQKCLLMADDDRNARELFQSKVIEFWDQIPEAIRPNEEVRAKRELAVRHGTSSGEMRKPKHDRMTGRSFIEVLTAGKKEAGRSHTYQHALFSEAGFYVKAEEMFLAVLQTIHYLPGTSIIIESTANGAGGEFHDMWKAAVEGKNDYIPLFFPWFIFPENVKPFRNDAQREEFIDLLSSDQLQAKEDHALSYEQLHWYQYTLWNNCNGDVLKLCQEHPATPEEAFTVSGTCRFDRLAMRDLELTAPVPVEEGWLKRRGRKWSLVPDKMKGPVQLFFEPVPGREYMVCCDAAEGLQDGDNTVIHVWDRKGRRLMAKVKGKYPPEETDRLLYQLGTWYNEALVVVERNGPGLNLLKRLMRMRYGRIYKETRVDSVTGKKADRAGYSTQKDSREHGIACLASMISMRQIHPDKPFIEECRNFIRHDGGKWAARSGRHDDEVSAGWIFAAVNFEVPYERWESVPKEKPEPTRVEKYEERILSRLRGQDGNYDPHLGSEF